MNKFKEGIKRLGVPYREIRLSPSKYSIKSPATMKPKYAVAHNTANSAPAYNEIAYMNRNNSPTSFHIAVDEKEAILSIPFNRMAYHAGNRYGNTAGIGVEIARSHSSLSVFKKAEDNGAKVLAAILYNYGWGMSKLKKHQDFSGKYCPHRTLDMGWERFVRMVRNYLNILNSGQEVKEEVKPIMKKYNINNDIQYMNTIEHKNENYVNVKDLAKVFGLNVGYDAVKKEIILRTRKTPIFIEGVRNSINTALVGGENYIRLRDAGDVFNLKIGYNGNPTMDTQTIKVQTEKGTKDIPAVNISGYNYVKIRDFADIVGRDVKYNHKDNIIVVK